MRLRTAHLICVLLLLRAATLFAYYEEAHQEIARTGLAILKKNDPNHLYEEIYFEKNSKRILAGSWQEDFGAVGGHDRAFRHYWDPDKNRGCPWFSYYMAMPAVAPGSKVKVPYGYLTELSQSMLNTIPVPEWIKYRWHYPGALQWAKNGAGSGDLRNWEGAINAYSYSANSREEAYWRLGHVVHLLTDMAEPDHTTNVPHAASGYYYPRDLPKISTLVAYSAHNKMLKAALDRLKRQLEIKSWNQEKTVGFEEFIELNVKKLFPSTPDVKSDKRNAFDTYFSVMASQSKAAVRDTHEFPLPLGISYLPEGNQAVILLVDDSKKNWSFFPSIHFQDKTESDKFVNLTKPLVTRAARLDAGIMEFFHDIVDPPPYVRSVLIKQEGKPRYHAWWKDGIEKRTGRHVNENKTVESDGNENEATKGQAKKDDEEKPKFPHAYSYDVVVSRELKIEPNEPLLPDKVASITIEFGTDPNGFDYPPERIKTAWVEIGGERIAGRLVDKGTTWQGQFTPSLEEGENETDLQMEISARDIHNHKDNRITFSSQDEVYGDKEYQLDTEPEYPAKAMPVPPYDWQKYRPGRDLNHLIQVKKKSKQGFILRIISVHETESGYLDGQVWMKIDEDIDSFEVIEAERWYRDSKNKKETQRVRKIKKGDRVEVRYEYPFNKAVNHVDQENSFWGVSTLTKSNRTAFVFSWAIGPGDTRSLKIKGKDEKGGFHEVEVVFRYNDWTPDPEHEGLYKRN